MVKKLSPSGAACRKCILVEGYLHRDGLMATIDRIVYAGAGGRGDELAARHEVSVAPFFVAKRECGQEDVFTSYLHFRRALTGRAPTVGEADDAIAREL